MNVSTEQLNQTGGPFFLPEVSTEGKPRKGVPSAHGTTARPLADRQCCGEPSFDVDVADAGTALEATV
jgi:hypothetical protein